MALATQCPFCQTTFRVVNDQLKLRDGLVRCGHCGEIFDGNAHLLPEFPSQNIDNLPLTAAAEVSPSIAPSNISEDARADTDAGAPNYETPPAIALTADDVLREMETGWDISPSSDEFSSYSPLADSNGDAGNTPMIEDESALDTHDGALFFEAPPEHPAVSEIAMHENGDAGDNEPQTNHQSEHTSGIETAFDHRDSDTVNQDNPPHQETMPTMPILSAVDHAETAGRTENPDLIDDDAIEPPEFVLHAQRRERWSQPRRVLTIILCVLLTFAGLAQSIYLGRNRLAIAIPSLKPLLIAGCQPLHCAVGPQRQIAQLSIESNELQADEPGQPKLTLSILLRNRSDIALAWPHVELTLNDNEEKALIRRVFTPADYLPATQTIEAGFAADTEQAVKLSFTLTHGDASGYRVYLFYP